MNKPGNIPESSFSTLPWPSLFLRFGFLLDGSGGFDGFSRRGRLRPESDFVDVWIKRDDGGVVYEYLRLQSMILSSIRNYMKAAV